MKGLSRVGSGMELKRSDVMIPGVCQSSRCGILGKGVSLELIADASV